MPERTKQPRRKGNANGRAYRIKDAAKLKTIMLYTVIVPVKQTVMQTQGKYIERVQLFLSLSDGKNDRGQLEDIQLDDKLHFIEEPVEIVDREVKQLKQSRIPIVKVRWNSRRGPEFTWERDDYFKSKYPHLFSNKKKANMKNQAPGRRSRKVGRM
ncbi:hypothetical protein Tco_0719861 [Tanacetum coccineum]